MVPVKICDVKVVA
uniref:Uncharacterized protein n=1 Tax=Arundo donax TaxID=35708 RepID=A0A0A9ARI4_ARUDO